MAKTKGNNPGKNLPGQQSRAKSHHVGPIKIEYQTDAEKRAQTLNKRRATIFKKMGELSKLTKTQFYCKWRTPSGSSGVYKSDGNGSTETETEVATNEEAVHNEIDRSDEAAQPQEQSEPLYPPPVQLTRENSTSSASSGEKSSCDICHEESVSKKKNDVWLNCEYKKGCNYWVHTLCVGIVVKRDTDLQDVKFYCPTHVKAFMK